MSFSYGKNKIYIILPVHNRRLVTEKFITCLVKQTYQNFQLILVDDGSTDGTSEMVKTYLPDTVILRGEGDWWWAGSLQRGINWLRKNQVEEDSIILMINDDTIFEADFLKNGQAILNNEPGAILLAQCYSLQSNTLIDAGVHINWSQFTFYQAKSKEEVNCFSTRGLFLFMKDVIKIGNFYPKLMPHYCSDYEYTIRAFNKGYRLITNKKLKLWVDETTTGFHTFNHIDSVLKRVKRYFSIKSTMNPFYLSIFIVLSCPLEYIPLNILRVWYTTAKFILKPLKNTRGD